MKKNTVKRSVDFDENVYDKLSILADHLDVGVSPLVNEFVKNLVSIDGNTICQIVFALGKRVNELKLQAITEEENGDVMFAQEHMSQAEKLTNLTLMLMPLGKDASESATYVADRFISKPMAK